MRFVKLGYLYKGIDPAKDQAAQERVDEEFLTTLRTYLAHYEKSTPILAPHLDEDLKTCSELDTAIKYLVDNKNILLNR